MGGKSDGEEIKGGTGRKWRGNEVSERVQAPKSLLVTESPFNFFIPAEWSLGRGHVMLQGTQ